MKFKIVPYSGSGGSVIIKYKDDKSWFWKNGPKFWSTASATKYILEFKEYYGGHIHFVDGNYKD